jgi:hypothetical protein
MNFTNKIKYLRLSILHCMLQLAVLWANKLYAVNYHTIFSQFDIITVRFKMYGRDRLM